MQIKEIKENKKQFLPLLLLADEQENMIDRYITVVALMSSDVTDSSLTYHLENAKAHGVTRREIAAIITHVGFYAGWPKAWAVFHLAKDSTDYNTVLEQAQHGQNIQARPELSNHVENFEQYDTILLGYPNWWASIPMPIASFLEEYDFEGKTIIPFCSHGGGRFGQSLTAIAKLAPNATMGDGLSIHYSGGSTLSADVEEWLKLNNIQ